jgi:hypothetical protein
LSIVELSRGFWYRKLPVKYYYNLTNNVCDVTPQLLPWYGYVQLIDIFPKNNSSEIPPGYLPNLKFRYF